MFAENDLVNDSFWFQLVSFIVYCYVKHFFTPQRDSRDILQHIAYVFRNRIEHLEKYLAWWNDFDCFVFQRHHKMCTLRHPSSETTMLKALNGGSHNELSSFLRHFSSRFRIEEKLILKNEFFLIDLKVLFSVHRDKKLI